MNEKEVENKERKLRRNEMKEKEGGRRERVGANEKERRRKGERVGAREGERVGTREGG